MRTTRLGLLISVVLVAGACVHVGPGTIERDNLQYGDALGESWKRQMLSNIVKLRYADPPTFLEVASVINQYSLEGQVSVNTPGWDRPSGVGPPVGGVAGRWSDRPTITYVPLSGERFAKHLLSPIPPVALISLLQSGWPVRFVFGTTVRSINGIANGTRAEIFRQAPDPRFEELLEALTRIQRFGALGLRIDRQPNGDVAIVVIRSADEDDDLREARAAVRRILELDPEATEFRLEYGPVSGGPREIAILSRSVFEIIGEFSFGIEVPPRHVEEGRVRPSPEFGEGWKPPTIRVRVSDSQPEDAFTAVPYRNHWFYIDDRDFSSKRTFTFLVIVMSLAESGAAPAAPLLTVGTGG